MPLTPPLEDARLRPGMDGLPRIRQPTPRRPDGLFAPLWARRSGGASRSRGADRSRGAAPRANGRPPRAMCCSASSRASPITPAKSYNSRSRIEKPRCLSGQSWPSSPFTQTRMERYGWPSYSHQFRRISAPSFGRGIAARRSRPSGHAPFGRVDPGRRPPRSTRHDPSLAVCSVWTPSSAKSSRMASVKPSKESESESKSTACTRKVRTEEPSGTSV